MIDLDMRVPITVLMFATCVPMLRADDKPSAQLLPVGFRKQLFVDDYLIESQVGLTRQLGKVTKANGGKPIFTEGRLYGTVLHDGGKFKLWYRKYVLPGGKGGFGYAESVDGLRFEKKAELSGINFAGDYTLAVEIDPHETDPAHRFKAAYDAPGMAAGVAHSADGIHWKPYNNGKPVTSRAADTYNQILWDEDARTYRLFTRTDYGSAGGTSEVRGNRGMTNPDVKARPAAWKTVNSWKFSRQGDAEQKRRQIYALTDWIYHGVHFALMTVYEWPSDFSEGPVDLQKRHERDVVNFYIGTSRDSSHWDFSWVYAGKPMIPRGPDGSFDKDILMPASTVVTHDDKHWLYYGGANERHGDPTFITPRTHVIGLATLRLDGFIYLEAVDRPGVVVTKAFRLDGSELEVNTDASAGSMQIEMLDEKAKPIAGYSGKSAAMHRNVDSLRLKPKWSNGRNLAELKGRTVRIRFRLKNAKLFSFRVVADGV